LIETYFDAFTEQQLSQLRALKGLYEKWNARINVISRKDMDHFYEHHVLHSLAIAACFECTPGMQVLDLGCGGGFPGIPLAIFFPETEFLLADSINKKLTVVKEVSAAIGLNNITTLHTRAEDIRDRRFDAVVSRAVAPLNKLWQWSRPLLRKSVQKPTGELLVPNGLVCLKGGDLAAEIAESGCKPMIWEIGNFFQEPYFREKYLLYVRL